MKTGGGDVGGPKWVVVGMVVTIVLVGGGCEAGRGESGTGSPGREEPTPQARATGNGDEPEDGGAAAGPPFVPPVAVEDGQQVVTLRFPGGVVAEVAYPSEVGVHRQGATPGGQLVVDADEGGGQRSVHVEVYRGSAEAVVEELGDEPPQRVGGYPGPTDRRVAVYEIDGEAHLTWEASGWVALAAMETASEELRTAVAAHVHLGEDADGWLSLTAEPPVRVRDPYVALGAPNAARSAARRGARADDDVVVVRASACTGPAERHEEPRRLSWCDPNTQLAFDVSGTPVFVQRLTEALEARTADYPANMIDPDWVTTSEKQAWQAQHGASTWVVGYFYPFDFDHARLAEADAEALQAELEQRWTRLDGNDRQLSRQQRLGEALTALTRPPPPRLRHTWDGRTLQLSSVRLDGAELVLDFDELAATAPGSTAAGLMALQLQTVISHYYPRAERLCVLHDGDPTTWLHDMLTCPSRSTN